MPGADSNWEPGLGKIGAIQEERAALGRARGNHGQMRHDTVRTHLMQPVYQFQVPGK